MCLATAVVVSAQTAGTADQTNPDVEETVVYDSNPHKVVTNTFWQNWFITAGLGANMYMGDTDSAAPFGDRLTFAMDLGVGKWFTPVVGVRAMYTGFNGKGASAGAASTGEMIENSNFYYAKHGISNLHVDFMLNLNTLFAGYKEERIWNCVPYIGVGLGVNKFGLEPVIPVGLINSFSVHKAWDINVDLRGTLVNDQFDGEMGGMNWEGFLTLSVGATYKLGKVTGWERPKTVTRTDRTEANALLKKLNAANSENATLKKDLANAQAAAKNASKPVVKQVAADDIVLFQIGESKLSKSAKVSLRGFAGIIKDMDPNTVYVITGYADAGTGSKARNERLSKERAEAAYNCLVKEYGVNPEQLKVEYKGGVENMFFNDPTLNRAVIISVQ